jgi:hypothetical protein
VEERHRCAKIHLYYSNTVIPEMLRVETPRDPSFVPICIMRDENKADASVEDPTHQESLLRIIYDKLVKKNPP